MYTVKRAVFLIFTDRKRRFEELISVLQANSEADIYTSSENLYKNHLRIGNMVQGSLALLITKRSISIVLYLFNICSAACPMCFLYSSEMLCWTVLQLTFD